MCAGSLCTCLCGCGCEAMFVHVHGVRVYGLGVTFMDFGLGACDGDSTDPRISLECVSGFGVAC